MVKHYLVYKREFAYKISYLVVAGSGKRYIPSRAIYVAEIHAESRSAATSWVKEVLAQAMETAQTKRRQHLPDSMSH